MIKALLFDFDDTISDRRSCAYRTYEYLLEDFIKDYEPYLKEAILQDCMLWDQEGNVSKNYVKDKLLQKYQIDVRQENLNDWWRANVGNFAIPFPETTKVLKELKRKYKLACITNGNNQSQYHKLKQSQLFTYFDFIITSEEAGAFKPDSAMFNKALENLDVKATEAIVIGDTFSADILGAHSASIKAIWFSRTKKPYNLDIKQISNLEELLKEGMIE